MSVFFEYGNFSRILEQKSSLFPPWTTNPKVGSVSVVFFAFRPASDIPVRTETKTHSALKVHCCNFSPFNFIGTILTQSYLVPSNHSDSLGSLSLQKKKKKKPARKKTKPKQKHILQLTVPE